MHNPSANATPGNPGPQEDAMRCAVSEHMDLRAGSGHEGWLDLLREGPVEFVVVPDAGARPTRTLEFRNIDGVLLADRVSASDAGRGIRKGRDATLHRTERELVRFARARRLPVVGIGHGAEFLGLYFGARLRPPSGQRPGDRHLDLRVAPGYGPPRAKVHPSGRSFCDPMGFPTVLSPFAWDGDGNIAGFVHQDEPILGIHWLPASPDDGAADLVLDVLHGRTPTGPPLARTNLSTGWKRTVK